MIEACRIRDLGCCFFFLGLSVGVRGLGQCSMYAGFSVGLGAVEKRNPETNSPLKPYFRSPSFKQPPCGHKGPLGPK